MQVAARTGVPQYDYEYEVVFEIGATYHLYGNATPLFDEQGRPSGAVGIFVDITERTRAEAETRRLGVELEIRRRLLEQREQERLKIARDLHDRPVQELTAATFALRGLLLRECSQEVAGQLEAVQASLKAQIQELRDYAGELRPPSLSKFGLEKTLRLYAEAFQEKHPEMQIQLETHFTGNLLPDPIRLALFRIYQQALANIVKHTQASEVHVHVIKDKQLAQLEIRDNGQGFVLQKEWLDLVRQGHLGLEGMRKRAEAVGGRLEVHTQPGRGAQIQVVAPLQGQEAISLHY